MVEVWKDIPGYEGRYQASNLGNILSLHYKGTNTPHLLKQSFSHDGYPRVNLCNGSYKSVKKYFVHLLIARTFIPNPENKPQINHIDGNKKNNCVDNLEWVTCKENIFHAINTGLRKIENHKYLNGDEHYASVPVLQYDLCGNFIKQWGCQSSAARYYNTSAGSINNCMRGITKSHKGFIWRYQESYKIPLKIEVEHHLLSPRIISQYSLNGELLRQWNGYKELFSEHPEYKATCISACCNNRRKTAYGYIWKSKFI